MSIFKRGETYYIRFQANGQSVYQSAKTQDKVKAQELHDKLKHELWKQAKLGDKPRYSWQDLIVRYMRQNTRKSYETDNAYVIWLHPIIGNLKLDEIDEDVIDSIISTKKAEGVKNSTANRIAQFVRTVLNQGKKWKMLDFVPVFTLLTEPRKRIRYLIREEADKLISEAPGHLSLMIRFALATGLRQANITHLEWNQINLEQRIAWIHHDQAKAGRAIAVPLNNDAMVVLREVSSDHKKRVFTYKGEPIDKANGKAYRNALARAKIENFTWHDLRHTWASWHVQNGTPLPVLQELGGWADISMVNKYAHLGISHIAEYANNVSSLNINRAKSVQSKKSVN